MLVLRLELGLAAVAAEVDGLAVHAQRRCARYRGDRHPADRVNGGHDACSTAGRLWTSAAVAVDGDDAREDRQGDLGRGARADVEPGGHVDPGEQVVGHAVAAQLGEHAVAALAAGDEAGEAVGVIGPNGAGKTTLMRVISGLIRPRAGTIAMQGTDVLTTPRIASSASASPTCRRTAGCSRGSRSRTTSRWAPSCPRRAPSTTERLDFVFDLFPRMKERRHQLAGTMSGGEQQMCAIGRALMSDPKLLLLDEPSAGLAPVVVQQVFELVKRIREGGLTVLIVEQNVQQVLKVVDRAYLLEAGTHPRLRQLGRHAGQRHHPAGLSRCVTAWT